MPPLRAGEVSLIIVESLVEWGGGGGGGGGCPHNACSLDPPLLAATNFSSHIAQECGSPVLLLLHDMIPCTAVTSKLA